MRGECLTIATILGLLTACGGGGTGFGGVEPPVIKNPPEVVPCGFGAMSRASLSKSFWEQWCERSKKMNGPYERYALDGTLIISGEYENNEPIGKWIWYHDNGDRMVVGSFEGGAPVGQWEWRHENGETAQRGGYSGGLRTGTWVTFFDEGAKASEGVFTNGKRDGNWVFWTEDERVMREQTWVEGDLISDNTPEQQPEIVGG